MLENMMDDVVYESKLHYIIFAWPIAMAVAGCALWYVLPAVKMLSYLFLGVAAIAAFMFYGAFSFSVFQIRRKTVHVQSGVFARQIVSLPLSNIETVAISQSILGAMLNYGTIILIGNGGTHNYFQNISDPLTCRRYLEQQINNG